MNFKITEQQQVIRNKIRSFVDDNVVQFADEWDSAQAIPRDIVDIFSEAGFFGTAVGMGYNMVEQDPYILGFLCEELGRGSMSLLSLVTVHGMVYQSIAKWGTDEQKENWLPRLATGKSLAAFALSEPNIGSDPKNVETVAESKAGGEFLLNGKKKWISCGQIADLYLVVAQCNGGPTAFLVERSNPGLSVIPIKGMYGFRSAMLAELHFDQCKVTEKSIVGKVGSGFSYVASTALDHGRYCVGWGCTGLSQACLDSSLEYSSVRKQFGVHLRKHQLIQQMISNMVTDIRAARSLCLQAAYLREKSEPDLIMETSITKYFASTVALKAANSAVQIHGANGCSSEFPVQRYLRDAKVTEIIEGSSQIQQLIISQYAYQRFLFGSKKSKEKKGEYV